MRLLVKAHVKAHSRVTPTGGVSFVKEHERKGDKKHIGGVITDAKLLSKLNSEKTVKGYRAMQIIDGKLYPPMSARVLGELRDDTPIGKWIQSEERPDLVDEDGKFKLDKGNKSTIEARYNPYFHVANTPLNDQFSSAYKRPNLVTVEVEIPISELSSGYRADKAKDSVGETNWKSGKISNQLDTKRVVTLSRYVKVLRIVPDNEVAQIIKNLLGTKKLAIPESVVTPSLKKELENAGVSVYSDIAKAHVKAHQRVTAQGNQGTFDAGNPDITKSFQLEGKTHYQGIPISIENRAGSVRSGTDHDGNPWEVQMQFAYGKIPYAVGSDGESLDVFVGPNPVCDKVFIIPIRKKGTKQYDEDKVFLGFETRKAVWDAFKAHYSCPNEFYSPMIEMGFKEFTHYVTTLKRGRYSEHNEFRKQYGLPIKKGFGMERVCLTLKTRPIQKGTVHSHQRVSKTGKVSIIPDFERVDKPSSVKIHHDIHKKKTGEFPFDVELHGLHEEKGKLLRFKSLEKALTKIISYNDGDMLATVYHGDQKMTLPVRKWTTIHREDFGLFGNKPNFQQIQETYKNMLDDQQRYVRITEPQAKQLSLFGKAMVWLTLKARRVLK